MRSLRRFFSLGLICLLVIVSGGAAANGSLGGGGFKAISIASMANQQAPVAGETLNQRLLAASGTEVLNGSSASGVKLTDPRNETYGNAASEGPRNEYGYRSGRSLVTTQGGSGENLALGKPASQSSTAAGGTADRAVDGNTNGNFAGNSVTHTGFENQPWWQVDLGSVHQIGVAKLWNRTDCCGSRLSNFYVLVSDEPFISTDLATTINQDGVSNYYVGGAVGESTEIGVNRSGRYVRVQLAGTEILSLAEVEVRGPVSIGNLALGKPAVQSSTGSGGDASRAVDGNTNGNFAGNSVTHTGSENQPWWQVDLGSVHQIGAIILWNRTDCCSFRLSNFYVLVSDAPFISTNLAATISQAGVSNYYTSGAVGTAKEIGVYRSGRYVRVHLAGTEILSLAEVEVRGVGSVSGCIANVPTNRWKGEYYNNSALTGSPTMVRDDSATGTESLNLDFVGGSPSSACGLAVDYFSARWTRTVNFSAGIYRFTVFVDNGARLYVDGHLRIDQWADLPPNTYTADVFLSAGNHEIKLEFFETWGGAAASLSWAAVVGNSCLANVPANQWRGEYYNNITLTGSLAMARNDGAGFLNFDFGGGSPSSACGVAVDNFSARWTRTVDFAAGIYRFSVTGDDGVRLYVDGQIKIDKWFSQGATTYTADVTLSAGSHEVKLEYFEGGGPGVAFLSWTLVTGLSCLPDPPLIGAARPTAGSENIATNAVSQTTNPCGQKKSD